MDKSRKWLAETHVKEARSRALRLVAFTGAVFPGEWGHSWNEVITQDLLDFGYHARKVNEFCGLSNEEFPSINKQAVRMSEGDPRDWEENYSHALNALMHMKSFVIGHAHADHRKIFLNAEANLIATYVKIETDRFSEVAISIFGLAECFLNHVIPKVRSKCPDLRF